MSILIIQKTLDLTFEELLGWRIWTIQPQVVHTGAGELDAVLNTQQQHHQQQ